MKNITPLMILFFLVSLSACTPEAPVEEETVLESLEGSWRLISYRDEGDTTWKQHPSTVIYEKHITPTHFCWIRYETDKDSLVGTGGGTYIYDNISKTYTEDIQFFLPAGSNILGQTIPFDVRYQDDKWYHTGYAKVYEFDPDLAENIAVDSTIIEEIWERTDADTSNSSLVGTWKLDSYKDFGDSLRSDYPDFVSYMKFITPSHFVWVHYIGEQDLVLAEGGGTYTYNGSTYTETLNFVYPSGSGQVGTVLPFECTIEDHTWYHKGYIKRMMEDPESGEMVARDSSRIDEVWLPYAYIN